MTTANSAAQVVVVGSLNMDLVVHALRLPAPGETLIGQQFSTDEGGKGANQAVAAARMGVRVAMVGRVGRDAHGVRLRSALERDGIDCGAVSEDGSRPSGVAAIAVAGDGENTIVVVPGANHGLEPAHVEAARAAIVAARVVVAQLEVPWPSVAVALALAHAAGVTTLLNAAPAGEVDAATLARVDWLIVNETEAASMIGSPVPDVPAARGAAEALRGRGPRHVVLTLGGAGLVHAGPEGTTHLRAPDVHAVDSTGAGDTFVGALAAALAQGLEAAEALHWGQAAAALAVTRRGSQSAMPTRAEVLAQGQVALPRSPVATP